MLGDQSTFDDLGADVGNMQPGEGQAKLAGQFTGERFHGDHQLWGGNRVVCPDKAVMDLPV
jgi:hypothetical protein